MPEVPKDWKPAGGGEEEIAYTLFDLTASGTTAAADITFFAHTRSASTLAVTNLEQAGVLPSAQRFLVKGISLLVDVNAAAGDSADVLDAASIEFFVNGKPVYSVPAAVLSAPVSISTSRTAELGGAVNMVSVELDKYITIPGGVPFKLVMTIGKTQVSATTDLTYMLNGRLVRPGG